MVRPAPLDPPLRASRRGPLTDIALREVGLSSYPSSEHTPGARPPSAQGIGGGTAERRVAGGGEGP